MAMAMMEGFCDFHKDFEALAGSSLLILGRIALIILVLDLG
jgi:hypothetical protein